MGQYFKNEQGEEVGLCPTCNKIKPKSHFVDRTHKNGFFNQCHTCAREQTKKWAERGHRIKENILWEAGGCVWPGCHMRYPKDLRGNFTLDHINPALKQHVKETKVNWISSNTEEFYSRVLPNLQVLCVHHNLQKRVKEYGVGGIMHVEPWEQDEEQIPHIDFNEVKLVLPGFEEYANRLT